MMRRLPGWLHWATMDYLFLRIMLALEGEGHRTFNLGLAPFAGVGEDPKQTSWRRRFTAWHPTPRDSYALAA